MAKEMTDISANERKYNMIFWLLLFFVLSICVCIFSSWFWMIWIDTKVVAG